MPRDRTELAKAVYRAFAAADREAIEALIAPEFSFTSPADPQGLDRAGYFERCWPNAETLAGFEYIRMVESGDEVIVTYESTKLDGQRFRNTEVLRFDGDQICETEVYFGWNL
jgi:ketosteroid isomerase-like protein